MIGSFSQFSFPLIDFREYFTCGFERLDKDAPLFCTWLAKNERRSRVLKRNAPLFNQFPIKIENNYYRHALKFILLMQSISAINDHLLTLLIQPTPEAVQKA